MFYMMHHIEKVIRRIRKITYVFNFIQKFENYCLCNTNDTTCSSKRSEYFPSFRKLVTEGTSSTETARQKKKKTATFFNDVRNGRHL